MPSLPTSSSSPPPPTTSSSSKMTMSTESLKTPAALRSNSNNKMTVDGNNGNRNSTTTTAAATATATTSSTASTTSIRNEWINAVFGLNFLKQHNEEYERNILRSKVVTTTNNNKEEKEQQQDKLFTTMSTATTSSNNTAKNNINNKKPLVTTGMGLSKISDYVSYTVTIPPKNNTMPSSNNNNEVETGGGMMINGVKMNKFQRMKLQKEKHNNEAVLASSGGGSNGSNMTAIANSFTNRNKVGVTLSKVSIGIYVKKVKIGSEAYISGIKENSILISINGLGILAEPSKQALERIWQYEKHFINTNTNNANTNNSASSFDANNNNIPFDQRVQSNGSNQSVNNMSETTVDNVTPSPMNNGGGRGRGTSQKQQQSSSSTTSTTSTTTTNPVLVLKFIHKNGQIYTSTLLGNAPYGITWGSCINQLPVIQRCYSAAQIAGVKRGSIIIAINDKSIIDNNSSSSSSDGSNSSSAGSSSSSGHNHHHHHNSNIIDQHSAANELRNLYQDNKEITLTLAFTPPKARTTYYEDYQTEPTTTTTTAAAAAAPTTRTEGLLVTTTNSTTTDISGMIDSPATVNGAAVNKKASSSSSLPSPTSINGSSKVSTTTTTTTRKKPMVSRDGVEVRVHPLKESLGSFLNCNADTTINDETNFQRKQNNNSNKNSNNNNTKTTGNITTVSDLATLVIDGKVDYPFSSTNNNNNNNNNRNKTNKKSFSSSSSSSSSSLSSPIKITSIKVSIPPSTIVPTNVYRPCPSLPINEIFTSWDTSNALKYCTNFYSSGFILAEDDDYYYSSSSSSSGFAAAASAAESYNITIANPNGGTTTTTTKGTTAKDFKSCFVRNSTSNDFKSCFLRNNGSDVNTIRSLVDTFLLQFVSSLCLESYSCSSDVDDTKKKTIRTMTATSPTKKLTTKGTTAPSSSASSAATTTPLSTTKKQIEIATEKARANAQYLLHFARCDTEFCQRLYFLLSSYIQTFEIHKKAESNVVSPISEYDPTHNLLSILQTLDILQSTQRNLVDIIKATSSSSSSSPSSLTSGMMVVETSNDDRSAVERPLTPQPNDKSKYSTKLVADSETMTVPSQSSTTISKKKKKGIFSSFRKKKSSSSNNMNLSQQDDIDGQPQQEQSSDGSLSSSPPSLAKGRRPSKISTSASSDNSVTTSPTSSSDKYGDLTRTMTSKSYTSTASSDKRHMFLTTSDLFTNMSEFLKELDCLCDTIERSLLKSISQKIAVWALQPWSATKETALSKVTQIMRGCLRRANCHLPLINPVESSELLVSVDISQCYILPSAHFPLLLTFNVNEKPKIQNQQQQQQYYPHGTPTSNSKIVRQRSQELETVLNEEKLYRTRVEIVSLTSVGDQSTDSYFVYSAIAGTVKASSRSSPSGNNVHKWNEASPMVFDTRSTWGAPKTLSVLLLSTNQTFDGQQDAISNDSKDESSSSSFDEVGSCWIDISSSWQQLAEEAQKMQSTGPRKSATCTYRAKIFSFSDTKQFDQHGDLYEDVHPRDALKDDSADNLEVEVRVSTEILEFNESSSGHQSRQRMLLYKHDDDIRQEMFAIQFIEICDKLLKASGLDLKLLTFQCMPIGSKSGFIEWVPGSVPLSDICDPSINLSKIDNKSSATEESPSSSEITKAGLTKYESLRNVMTTTSSQQQQRRKRSTAARGSLLNNPIQEFLRSVAYDPDGPFLIKKDVMDVYIKSCAGYCVLTYLLGVGDRHLDNLLLHQSGHFFHCDYSFILGNDPKKYLPMRITEDMIHGLGGKESDNYSKFISLAGAAFVTLRRHENVRVLLSLIRLMAPSVLPDISVNQNIEDIFLSMRQRLRLDLNDNQAISYMEQLIETSTSSKMWLAVDAIHSLGKAF